jgi:uroporphyrin-III C-methyltransferase/precorrin-2 dehydrogenase/sirohydrochlorin ferrochelatase
MYLPIFINIAKHPTLIIGGGDIALAKLESLIGLKAQISLVAPHIKAPLLAQLEEHKVSYRLGNYKISDLDGQKIIIAATNDQKLNLEIYHDAKAKGLLVNVVDNPQYCDFIFPAIVKRGKLQIAISSQGISPVLARFVKEKIGRAIPANFSNIIAFAAEYRDKVKEKIGNIQARRLFWYEVFSSKIAENLLTNKKKSAQTLFEDKLRGAKNTSRGAVYFIGSGVGDAEYLTLKAVRLLGEADVVLYDRLMPQAVLDFARRDALKIDVGKSKDQHKCSQGQINEMLAEYAQQGKIVARLKGGDVAIFANLADEIAILRKHGVDYQIVPGITAAAACAASVGIPLTLREEVRACRLLTLYKKDIYNKEYWQELAQSNDSLVFYMSAGNSFAVAENLLNSGIDPKTPMMVVENGAMLAQKEYFCPIAEFAKKFAGRKFESPSLIIIGKVVTLHAEYAAQNKIKLG